MLANVEEFDVNFMIKSDFVVNSIVNNSEIFMVGFIYKLATWPVRML